MGDSPIEDLFRDAAAKHFKVAPQEQVRIVTQFGKCYVDFMSSSDGRRCVFECDGRDYHRPSLDLVRDAILLGENQCDVVYRLPGRLLWNHVGAAFYPLSRWEPQLFNPDAIKELEKSSFAFDLESDRAAWLTRRKQPDDESLWMAIYQAVRGLRGMKRDELLETNDIPPEALAVSRVSLHGRKDPVFVPRQRG